MFANHPGGIPLYIEMKKLYFFILLFLSAHLACAASDPMCTEGQGYFLQHRFDSAAIYFTKVIQQHPERMEGYYNRGLTFYRLRMYNEAVSDLNRCMNITPANLDAQFIKAVSLEKGGNVRAAIKEFELLHAKKNDYDEVEKRIKNYRFAVYISEKWYYMLAIMFLVVVLMAIIARSLPYRKW